jgi:hypothetical protein
MALTLSTTQGRHPASRGAPVATTTALLRALYPSNESQGQDRDDSSARAKQIKMEPLCRFCQQRGVITLATVADHIEPHRDDWTRLEKIFL